MWTLSLQQVMMFIYKLNLFSLPEAKYQARYISPKEIGHTQYNSKSKNLVYFHFDVRSLQKMNING